MHDTFSGHHFFCIYIRESVDENVSQNSSYFQRNHHVTGSTKKL